VDPDIAALQEELRKLTEENLNTECMSFNVSSKCAAGKPVNQTRCCQWNAANNSCHWDGGRECPTPEDAELAALNSEFQNLVEENLDDGCDKFNVSESECAAGKPDNTDDYDQTRCCQWNAAKNKCHWGGGGECPTPTTAEHRRRRGTTATTAATAADPVPVHVKGDPHIVNVKGEHFDIMATGNMLMLEVPHKSTADNLKMAIHADIERLDMVECGPTFIKAVQMTGSWLEHNTVEIRAGSIKASKKTFSVRVNGDNWVQHADFHEENKGIKKLGPEATISTTEKQFLLKVHALDITVKQPDRPRAFLDVHVGNIGQLHMEVGGLLGVAEHDEVARVPEKCKNGLGLNRIQQESDQVRVFASASIMQHSLSQAAEDYFIPEAKSAASVASGAALLVLSVIWAAANSL